MFYRCVRCLMFLFVASPLLLTVLYYINYTPPRQHTTATHLAYRPKEVVDFTAIYANVDGHSKFPTSVVANKLEDSSGYADSMPNKILTWLYSISGGNPESVSTVEVPFNKSYSESYRYLIPRAAFFDKRMRGKHNNAMVILTHIMKSMIKPVGCIVDGQHTFKVELKPIIVNGWIHKMHPECTHDNVFIFCFDTPGRNNS